MARRRVVKDDAAADGLERRIKADHEAVAALRGDALGEAELGIGALTGGEGVTVEQHDLGKPRRRAVAEVDARAVFNGALRIPQAGKAHVEQARDADAVRLSQRIAADNVSLFNARQIHRHALTGDGDRRIFPVDLQIAHAAARAGGQQLGLAANVQRALDERAGDDGAEAVHRKHAVDGQAERDAGAFFPRLPHKGVQHFPQIFDPLPGGGGGLNDRRVFQKGPLHARGELRARHGEPVGVREVAFGEDDHAAAHAEKREDIQMLDRLWHEALVRRDDKHRKVDAARAGEHGFDEFLVTRHVHSCRLESRAARSRARW